MMSYMLLVSAILMTSLIANIEANPARGSHCEEEYFHCPSDNQCVPQEWVCDGEEDCHSGEDESQDCDNHRHSCEQGYFACDRGRCIVQDWVCDKDNDCMDATDEASCSYAAESAGQTRSRGRRHLRKRETRRQMMQQKK